MQVEWSINKLIGIAEKEKCDCVIALSQSGNSFQMYANRLGFVTVPLSSATEGMIRLQARNAEICSCMETGSIVSLVKYMIDSTKNNNEVL